MGDLLPSLIECLNGFGILLACVNIVEYPEDFSLDSFRVEMFPTTIYTPFDNMPRTTAPVPVCPNNEVGINHQLNFIRFDFFPSPYIIFPILFEILIVSVPVLYSRLRTNKACLS